MENLRREEPLLSDILFALLKLHTAGRQSGQGQTLPETDATLLYIVSINKCLVKGM